MSKRPNALVVASTLWVAACGGNARERGFSLQRRASSERWVQYGNVQHCRLASGFSSAPSDRPAATRLISCYVSQFDIVNVQEDFNYHAALYDSCNDHPFRSPTSGGVAEEGQKIRRFDGSSESVPGAVTFSLGESVAANFVSGGEVRRWGVDFYAAGAYVPALAGCTWPD